MRTITKRDGGIGKMNKNLMRKDIILLGISVRCLWEQDALIIMYIDILSKILSINKR